MKRVIAVSLSDEMATRLTAEIERRGTTQSTLVEAALGRFLDAGSGSGVATIVRCLSAVAHRLDQIDRDLKTVNETVALHARFHLATTPALSPADLAKASSLGSSRFDEFAAQVQRRVLYGPPLIGETLDRRNTGRGSGLPASEDREVAPIEAEITNQEPGHRTSSAAAKCVSKRCAAVGEDGGEGNFQNRSGGSVH